MRRLSLAVTTTLTMAATATVALAQRGGGDWMTAGFDAQRSHWVRNDGKISRESMAKPGFELVWKLKFDNTARQLNTVTPPALLDFFIGHRGFRALGFFGGSSDRMIGVDIDLARIEWQKNFSTAAAAPGTIDCPGGLTAGVTRPLTLAYPPVPTGAGPGRGTPAKGGVGEPYEGAVTLKNRPVAPPKPMPAKPAAGAAAAFNPFAPRIQWAVGLTGDGKLHSVYVSNGDEPNPAVPFVPAGAHALGLMVFDNTAYTATVNGCGGAANGVWALDLGSKAVTQWKAAANVAGTVGPAAGPDGTLYVAAGNEVTALEAKTLKPLSSYKADAALTSSPVVFEYKGKNLAAVTSTDGRLHLVDTAALATPLDKSAVFSGAGYATGALTSWQDPSGTRWILAPASGSAATGAGFSATNGAVTNGAVVAWKVVEKGGVPALAPGWMSRDLVSPTAPVVINGVVFALSSGEFRSADPKMTAAQRAQKSVPAVVYALDGATGKELWSSGKTITSFVHSGTLSAGGSRIYVAGNDGTQYAFSFPIEH